MTSLVGVYAQRWYRLIWPTRGENTRTPSFLFHPPNVLLISKILFFLSFLQYETPGLLEGVNDFFSVVNPKLVIELPPTEHKKEIYLSASAAPRVTSRMSRNAIANDRREEDVVGGRGVV